MAAAELFNSLSPYFQAPALPDPETATAPSQDWVLLDTKGYVSDRRNGTTATASASNGIAVDATFCFAAPRTLSHFCVHFKDGDGEDRDGYLLWCGIMLCNVLDVDDDHILVVRFIPLPRPMNRNRDNLYQDVAYANGSIRLVEMETWEEGSTPKSKRRRGPPDDVAIPDMQFDSELELDEDDDINKEEEEDTEVTFGWRAVAWAREGFQEGLDQGLRSQS